MQKNLGAILVALAIVGVVGFTAQHIQSGWALLGLIFLGVVQRSSKFKTVCPKCENEFTAVKRPEQVEPTAHFNCTQVIIGVAICVAVGTGVWLVKSGWVLLGLIFLEVIETPNLILLSCPRCNHQFTAFPKSDDEEDDE